MGTMLAVSKWDMIGTDVKGIDSAKVMLVVSLTYCTIIVII